MIEEKQRSNPKAVQLLREILARLGLSLREILPEIIAIIVAFLIGGIALLATGHSPIEAYGAMINGGVW